MLDPLKASENFLWTELECPCCGLREIRPSAIEALQNLRISLRKALKVNSGCRCPKHNAAISGAPKSRHLPISDAFDISIVGWTPEEIEKFKDEAVKLGFKGMGTAKTFIHIDMRPFYAKWTY